MTWTLEIAVVFAISVCLTGFRDSDIAQTVVIGGTFVVKLVHGIFFLPMSDLPSNVQEILASLIGALIIIVNFLGKRGILEVDGASGDAMAIAVVAIIGLCVLIAFAVIGHSAVVGKAAIRPDLYLGEVGEFRDWAAGGGTASENFAAERRKTMAELFDSSGGDESQIDLIGGSGGGGGGDPFRGMYQLDVDGNVVHDSNGVPVLSDQGIDAQMASLERVQAEDAAAAAAAANQDENTIIAEVVDFFSGLFNPHDQTAAQHRQMQLQQQQIHGSMGDASSVVSERDVSVGLPASNSFTDLAQRRASVAQPQHPGAAIPTSQSFTDLAQRRASVAPRGGGAVC
jgi:hypothetical protein